MAKFLLVYSLLIFVSCTLSIGQTKVDLSPGNNKPETGEVINSRRPTIKSGGLASFSGEWKLNEAKKDPDEKFPVCIFGEGDHALSKMMKIAVQNDFLVVTVERPFPYGVVGTSQEKLTFDGKESEATVIGSPREKLSARWSDDDQTMTVSSVKSFKPIFEDEDIKVTEVWKLINDGKSISLQVNSSSVSGENSTMNLVYDKQ